MNSFYITLPSDSSMDIYPSNTQCCFKVKLPQKIKLEKEKWEVALVEMIMPSQFENVSKEDGYFDLVTDDAFIITKALDLKRKNFTPKNFTTHLSTESNDTAPTTYRFRFQIPAGSYRSLEHLIDTMNDMLQEGFRDIFKKREEKLAIGIAHRSNRPKMVFSDSIRNVELQFSPKLNFMLGGKNENVPIHSRSLNPFPYNTNINIGVNQVFVYSDIVEYSIVGHIQAPILRVLPFSSTHLGMTDLHYHREFQNLHYIPVAKSDFDTIEINIRGDTGEPIHFIVGKAMVKLHFKKRDS